jgi:hypothetical protein
VLFETLAEGDYQSLGLWIVLSVRCQIGNPAHLDGLLRPQAERQRCNA